MPTPDGRVVLRVFAIDPATQIVVVDPLNGVPENARATGELSVALPPGQYSIVHWVGSREPREQTVTLESGMPERTLEIRDVPDRDSPPFAWLERLGSASRQVAAPVFVWRDTQVRVYVSGLPSSMNDIESHLWLGSVESRQEYERASSASIATAAARVPPDQPSALGIRGPSEADSFPILLRPLPACSWDYGVALEIDASRRAGTRRPDLRRSRYSLLMSKGFEWDDPQLSLDRSLIERLARPGGISEATFDRVVEGRVCNELALVAAVLLYARGEAELDRVLVEAALEKRESASPGFTGIPDVQMLSSWLRSGAHDSDSVRLQLPVLSETWRLLSRQSLSWWLDREVRADAAALRASGWASTAGDYFCWSEPRDLFAVPVEGRTVELGRALRAASEALVGIANKVSLAVERASDSLELSEELDWANRTSLQRRIMNYLMAHFPEDYFEQGALPLEDLALQLGVPLPLVAAQVNKLQDGGTHSSEPPGRKPSPAEAVEVGVLQDTYTYA
jgi:hypothetical protein